MNFLLHPFPQCFHSYETENNTGLCNTQHHPTVHALLSWHVQILQMETCACLINYKECTLRIPLQNLSAEKYAIKKPQGMWAVCSPCPTSVPTLQFQGKSQTICADLFELESWRGGRVISKGKGSVKMGRKGGGKTVFLVKQSLNLRAVVQCYTHTAIVDGLSGIWTCAVMNQSTYTHYCKRLLRDCCVSFATWF